MTFTEKIIDIQQKYTALKTENNEFGGYQYRNIEKMLISLKPLLKENNLLISFNDKLVHFGDRYYIESTATITDGESSVHATALAREEYEKKKSDASQLTGSASTYARKYALSGLLGVDDGANDPDSKDNDRKHYEKPAPKKTQSLDVATEKQRNLISEKLGAIGFTTNEEIKNYLSTEYGINGKLTKADASMVIEDLLSSEAPGTGVDFE